MILLKCVILTLHLLFKISIYRHKSGLTDVGWYVSITYMIISTQLTNKGLMTCGAYR